MRPKWVLAAGLRHKRLVQGQARHRDVQFVQTGRRGRWRLAVSHYSSRCSTIREAWVDSLLALAVISVLIPEVAATGRINGWRS